MPNVRQTLILKRWNLYLRSFFDLEMLEDIAEQYDDEMDESCARILNLIEVCEREGRVLTPEVAAGAIIGILAECACVTEIPEIDQVIGFGLLLAKETGFRECCACCGHS